MRFKGFGTLRLTNGRSEVAVKMDGRVVADDLEALKALAVLGEGIAWLPDFLAAAAFKSGELVPVLPEWTSKGMEHIHFLYPGRKYLAPKVQAFMQLAQEIMVPTTTR